MPLGMNKRAILSPLFMLMIYTASAETISFGFNGITHKFTGSDGLIYSDGDLFTVTVEYDTNQAGQTNSDYTQYLGFGIFEYGSSSLRIEENIDIFVFNEWSHTDQLGIGINSQGVGNGGPSLTPDWDIIQFQFSSNAFELNEIPVGHEGLLFTLVDSSGLVFSDESLPTSFELNDYIYPNSMLPPLYESDNIYALGNFLTGDGAHYAIDFEITEAIAIPEPSMHPLIVFVFVLSMARKTRTNRSEQCR